METQIKFRGKRIGFDKWLYFDMTHHLSDDSGVPPDFLQYQLDVKTVGQLWNPSIGLEFYTGDLFLAICSLSGYKLKKERICKVCSDGKGMSIAIWNKGEWWAYSSMNFTTAKLIGNIFDNPDLLK